MKKLSILLGIIFIAVNSFAATITIPDEAQNWNIPAEAIDVLQARDICKNLSASATTGTKYYVMGYIKKIDASHATNVSKYGNASFYIEQVKGANSTEDFYAYRVYGIDGKKITNQSTVAVGDFVVLYGELTKYQKNASSSPIYETVGSKAYIWNSTNPIISGSNNDNPSSDNTDEQNGVITITNIDQWTTSEMSQFVGQTVEFTNHFYVTNNTKSGQLTIAPRRIFNPTNQALPLSTEYHSLLTLNDQGTLTLTNVSGYHRIDERLHNLKVKVNSTTSVSLVSCNFRGNTRAEMEQGYNLQTINARGEHTLLVCYMNLEYYIVEAFDSYGPANNTEHQAQRTKVSKALAKINADLYAFVEIQLGQGALAELAADLTKNTGRNFTYINDGSSINGTYTKSGYVYCSDKVTPYGSMIHNNTYVSNRKKVQGFIENATGEKFILSVNHFKAKSGNNATGANADQGDGQGQFNAARIREAQSIITNYPTDTSTFGDEDFLIVGDLNAYGKEDPITTLTNWGMIDLHRSFHADSSYSYVYQGTLGYLDHALCNSTLYPQVTGMLAYHINSPEKDGYTYDGSLNDETMFRCSDHDPILVGLRLGKWSSNDDVTTDTEKVYFNSDLLSIENAQGGVYAIYSLDGRIILSEPITTPAQTIQKLSSGIYVMSVRTKDGVWNKKIHMQ